MFDIMCDIEKDNHGHLSLMDYATSFQRNYARIDRQVINNSELLVAYKKIAGTNSEQKNATIIINMLLSKAIKEIIDLFTLEKNVILVGIPSSTVERDKSAPIKNSITTICKTYFLADKRIIDGSDFLKRKYDISTNHKGQRNDFDAIIQSTECRNNLDSKSLYILLDDITTRGVSFRANSQILREHGAKYIICLAIGSTMLGNATVRTNKLNFSLISYINNVCNQMI